MATFPSTVSADPEVTSKGAGPGPFEDGVNRYLVLINNNPFPSTLAVYKSTDFGVTWVEQDAADEPSTSNGFPTKYWATQDKAHRILYIAHWDLDDNLILEQYDITTDTWGSPVTSSINCADSGLTGSGDVVCQYRPATNDVLAVFADHTASIIPFGNFGRTAFAVCNLASWSAATDCGLTADTSSDLYSWFPMGIVLDTANNANVFYQGYSNATPPSSFPQQLQQQQITSGLGINPLQLIDSYVNNQEIIAQFFISVTIGDDNTIKLAYAAFDNTEGDISSTQITYSQGTAGVAITFVTATLTVGDSSDFIVGAGTGVSVAYRSELTATFVSWVTVNEDTGVFTFGYQQTIGSTTTTATLGITDNNISGLTSAVFASNMGAYVIAAPGTQYYYELGNIGPPTPPTVIVSLQATGGYKPYFPVYNCHDCYLQVQQLIWDQLVGKGLRTYSEVNRKPVDCYQRLPFAVSGRPRIQKRQERIF